MDLSKFSMGFEDQFENAATQPHECQHKIQIEVYCMLLGSVLNVYVKGVSIGVLHSV